MKYEENKPDLKLVDQSVNTTGKVKYHAILWGYKDDSDESLGEFIHRLFNDLTARTNTDINILNRIPDINHWVPYDPEKEPLVSKEDIVSMALVTPHLVDIAFDLFNEDGEIMVPILDEVKQMYEEEIEEYVYNLLLFIKVVNWYHEDHDITDDFRPIPPAGEEPSGGVPPLIA